MPGEGCHRGGVCSEHGQRGYEDCCEGRHFFGICTVASSVKTQSLGGLKYTGARALHQSGQASAWHPNAWHQNDSRGPNCSYGSEMPEQAFTAPACAESRGQDSAGARERSRARLVNRALETCLGNSWETLHTLGRVQYTQRPLQLAVQARRLHSVHRLHTA